jgi:F0F1-type ATP synthase epsilon subunit
MHNGLRLTVLTPAKTLLDVAGVDRVRLRLSDGAWISVYPRHASLVAETVAGPLQYRTADGEKAIDLAAGILEIAGDVVTVFAGGSASPDALEADASEDAVRFDRLTQTLLTTLQAQAGDVLEKSDDED